MKLTPRLQKVAAQVPAGSVAADIGTDHGYIPVYLMMNRICRRVIATDANPGPLDSARQTVELFNLRHSISLRRGDGLSVLSADDTVDVVIVAGMGGELIVRILDGLRQLPGVRRLVLQPMNNAGEVRRWLAANGWDLVAEDLVREGETIYEIIVAEAGGGSGSNQADQLLAVGPLLVKCRHHLLPDLLTQRIESLQRAAAGAARADSGQGRRRHKDLLLEIARLEEVLNWLAETET